MTKQEIIYKAEKLKWLQCIELCEGYLTKGEFDYCHEDIATNRFGMPSDLTGKTVLDIGACNLYHSLLAEKRGATVTAIEPNQGGLDNTKCCQLVLKTIDNKINFGSCDLDTLFIDGFAVPAPYDLCLLYGVLYHTTEPIKMLQQVYKLTKEDGCAIIETAISPEIEINGERQPIWQFRNGHDGDKANFWYCNLTGLEAVLKYVGFSQVELIWTDSVRATVKTIK